MYLAVTVAVVLVTVAYIRKKYYSVVVFIRMMLHKFTLP